MTQNGSKPESKYTSIVYSTYSVYNEQRGTIDSETSTESCDLPGAWMSDHSIRNITNYNRGTGVAQPVR